MDFGDIRHFGKLLNGIKTPLALAAFAMIILYFIASLFLAEYAQWTPRELLWLAVATLISLTLILSISIRKTPRMPQLDTLPDFGKPHAAENSQAEGERNSLADLTNLTEAMLDATSQIFSQHLSVLPAVSILEQKMILTVSENGDCKGVEYRKQLTNESPHYMELFKLLGDPPVRDIQEIAIRAESRPAEARNIVILPAYSKPTEKRFIAFFLPIVPAEEVHAFTFHWRWPKLWHRLLEGKAEHWEIKMAHNFKAEKLEVCFRLHKSLRMIDLSNRGQGGGRLTTNGQTSEASDYVEYVWEAEKIDFGMRVDLHLDPR